MTGSFYILKDGLLHPQQPATGSWNKGHQNGVAVGGALIREAERIPTPQPMTICRVTIDIMRAVPFMPIISRAHILREGHKLQLVRSELVAEGQVVASATVLRARQEASPPAPLAHEPYPLPDAVVPVPVTSVLSAGHPMETRMVKGHPRQNGPGAYWTRFNVPLVTGEALSPVARVAMAADIASAPSSEFDHRAWTFANLDLSIYLTREPEGEWIYIECETQGGGVGTGLVNSVLADARGIVGRAHQTLFLNPRAA